MTRGGGGGSGTCYRAVTRRDQTLPLPIPQRRRFVRREAIAGALRERRLTHRDLAGLLGLHPSTWSRLFNRHRPLTRWIRLALLACPALVGVAEVDLWEVVELSPKELS